MRRVQTIVQGVTARFLDRTGQTTQVIHQQRVHGRCFKATLGQLLAPATGAGTEEGAATNTQRQWMSGSRQGEMVLACDVNGDAFCDGTDFDELAKAIRESETNPKYDLSLNFDVGLEDRGFWINDLMMTTSGDATLDGSFSSSDLVAVFQANKFESGVDAGWATGDWTGDGLLTTADLVLAFRDGKYEQRPVELVNIPEPKPIPFLLMSFLVVLGHRRNVRSTCRIGLYQH